MKKRSPIFIFRLFYFFEEFFPNLKFTAVLTFYCYSASESENLCLAQHLKFIWQEYHYIIFVLHTSKNLNFKEEKCYEFVVCYIWMAKHESLGNNTWFSGLIFKDIFSKHFYIVNSSTRLPMDHYQYCVLEWWDNENVCYT